MRNETQVPDKCGFYKWMEDYEKVVAGKFGQSNNMLQRVWKNVPGERYTGANNANVEVKAKAKNMMEEGKMDKLISLVQLLVLISVVIVIFQFLGLVLQLVK